MPAKFIGLLLLSYFIGTALNVQRIMHARREIPAPLPEHERSPAQHHPLTSVRDYVAAVGHGASVDRSREPLESYAGIALLWLAPPGGGAAGAQCASEPGSWP